MRPLRKMSVRGTLPIPAALGRRLLQGFAGDARLPLLLGIETREMVPWLPKTRCVTFVEGRR
jgi:hypothetical protein